MWYRSSKMWGKMDVDYDARRGKVNKECRKKVRGMCGRTGKVLMRSV